MTKHEITQKAIKAQSLREEIEALKVSSKLNDLENEYNKLRKEIDKFTNKKSTDLLYGVQVLYTETHNFSQDLLKAAHPEINLDDYIQIGSRFKDIEVPENAKA